ncbi:hypothetical protein ADUPG1_007352, partial [Aduncisulcus paluster]
LHTLKTQVEREQRAMDDEWRELGRVLERGHKIKEKTTKTTDEEELGELPDPLIIQGAMSLAESGVRSGSTSSLHSELTADDLEGEMDVVEALSVLCEYLGIAEPLITHPAEEIAGEFVKREDQNFSLYNLANELQNEAELLEESITRLKQDLAKAEEKKQAVDDEVKEQCRVLEETNASFKKQSEKYSTNTKKLNEDLSKIAVEIARLFVLMKCAPPSSLETEEAEKETTGSAIDLGDGSTGMSADGTSGGAGTSASAGAGSGSGTGAGSGVSQSSGEIESIAAGITADNILEYLSIIESSVVTEQAKLNKLVQQGKITKQQVAVLLKPKEQLESHGFLNGSTPLTPSAAVLVQSTLNLSQVPASPLTPRGSMLHSPVSTPPGSARGSIVVGEGVLEVNPPSTMDKDTAALIE